MSATSRTSSTKKNSHKMSASNNSSAKQNRPKASNCSNSMRASSTNRSN